jgi:hypothetical protein
MKTFDFIQSLISHHLKDPHPKALEPDCLSPPFAITMQSLDGEGEVEVELLFCANLILRISTFISWGSGLEISFQDP